MPALFSICFVFTGCIATSAMSQESAPAPIFDEWSINDVWHQAKLRGVSFRAVGQEPGWLLEITNGSKILLVLDYGQSSTAYAYVEPEVYPELRKTRYRTGDVEVLIEGKDCRDSMSGEEFAVTVTITVKDRRLTGCGRALH